MDGEPNTSENPNLKFAAAPLGALPVTIAIPSGLQYQIPIDATFDSAAARAVEYVRNRRQWRKLASARDYIQDILDIYLPQDSLSRDDQLKTIARAGGSKSRYRGRQVNPLSSSPGVCHF